jgi:hypothetical protein
MRKKARARSSTRRTSRTSIARKALRWLPARSRKAGRDGLRVALRITTAGVVAVVAVRVLVAAVTRDKRQITQN